MVCGNIVGIYGSSKDMNLVCPFLSFGNFGVELNRYCIIVSIYIKTEGYCEKLGIYFHFI